MRWSNGAEITSADLKFGWNVGMNKQSGPYCSGTCDVISRIDTPNKYTAVLHTRSPFAPILAYGVPPVFPHTWKSGSFSWKTPAEAAHLIFQDQSFNYQSANFPTNGAYQVKSFNKDDRIVLQPMKYYTGMTCGAAVKNLIFSFYSSKPGLIAGAASGETDVTGGGGGYTPADIGELRKHNGYKLYQTPSFSLEHLEYNVDKTYNGKPNPLANAKVRQAVTLAIDKIGLIRSALGVSAKQAKNIAAWSIFVDSPGLVQPFANRKITGQWDPIAKKYTTTTGTGKAVTDAKKLLNQTPYKGGFDLSFKTTTANPVRAAQAGVIQQNLAKIGIRLNVEYVPASKYFGQWDDNGDLHRGDFQIAMLAFSGSPDPDQDKYNMQTTFIDRNANVHTPLNQNYSGIRDRTIDQAFNKAAKTLNNKTRAKYYAVVQERTNKNAYWAPLYYRPSIATRSTKVKNFSNNPTQLGPTWNIYKWATAS
jgi:peptide/nickel transport system substrate-binding protein